MNMFKRLLNESLKRDIIDFQSMLLNDEFIVNLDIKAEHYDAKNDVHNNVSEFKIRITDLGPGEWINTIIEITDDSHGPAYELWVDDIGKDTDFLGTNAEQAYDRLMPRLITLKAITEINEKISDTGVTARYGSKSFEINSDDDGSFYGDDDETSGRAFIKIENDHLHTTLEFEWKNKTHFELTHVGGNWEHSDNKADKDLHKAFTSCDSLVEFVEHRFSDFEKIPNRHVRTVYGNYNPKYVSL